MKTGKQGLICRLAPQPPFQLSSIGWAPSAASIRFEWPASKYGGRIGGEMRKFREMSDEHSCLNRAHDEEWLFVLLGRDEAAPYTIRQWAAKRISLGKNDPNDKQIKEALKCADFMEAERRKP